MTTIGLKYRFICNGTSNQVLKLPTTTNTLVAKLNAPLYRAYLLKEQPRMIFHVGYEEALRSRASNPTTYPRAKNSVFALRCRPRAIECAVDEVAGRVLRKANCSATEVTCARVPQVCCRLRGVQQTPEHERRNGQCWRQDRDRLDRLNDSPPCSTHGRHPHKDVGCKTICSSSPAWRLPDSRWRKHAFHTKYYQGCPDDHQSGHNPRLGFEARGGCPASVNSTRKDGDLGLLRIDFHSVIGEHTLECVPWDEWFRGSEENKLAFLYEDARDSRFNKLIERDKSR